MSTYGYDRKRKPCEHKFTDNQGRCWRCGKVLNQDWHDAYYGRKEDNGHEKDDHLSDRST